MLAGGFADVRVLLDGLITVDFGSELAMIDSEPGGPGGLVMKGFGVKLEAGSVLAVDCSVSDPMGDPLEGELNIAPEPWAGDGGIGCVVDLERVVVVGDIRNEVLLRGASPSLSSSPSPTNGESSFVISFWERNWKGRDVEDMRKNSCRKNMWCGVDFSTSGAFRGQGSS
jgi:hypothetical protein